MKNTKEYKIADQIRDLKEHHLPISKKNLNELQEYAQKMADKGLVKKREYNIPLVDTIGRTMFWSDSVSRQSGLNQLSTNPPLLYADLATQRCFLEVV